MPTTEPIIISFAGGPNPRAAPHLINDDQVVTATNVDFGQDPGTISARRGSVRLTPQISTGPIKKLFKHYKNVLGSSQLYVVSGANIYRTAIGTSSTSIGGNYNGDAGVAVTQFKDYFYTIGTSGAASIKDNGSATYDWIKSAPATAPSVAAGTLAPLTLVSTYWLGEGTLSSQASGTATFTVDKSPFRIQINGTLTTNNLNLNGTNTIGDYGIDHVELLFDDPSKVTRVSRDYSIDDGEFTNYWHTEMDLEFSEDALTDPETLVESQLQEGTSTDTAVDQDLREDMLSSVRTNFRPIVARISAAKNSFNLWSVPRPHFELINKTNSPTGWTNIGACRIVIEATAPVEVKVRNWQVSGAVNYPLNDPEVGYSWCETWAEFINGVKVEESAPGPFSTRLKLQQSQALATGASAAGLDASYTHRILYRQGGYTRDFYAVATNAIGTAAYTDTLSDVQALTINNPLERGILHRASFPNNVIVASEPFYNRLFVMNENRLRWSLPNRPGAFPARSNTFVSHAGDEGKGLIVWPPGLIIVNRDSVYEMQGSVFEGNEANWVLSRTGSRHGSKAPHTIIKTPFGIPLLELDGLYMYVPGQGIDQPIPWLTELIGDAWKGVGASDPAALKGNRVPAINRGAIHHSCAEFYDNKLYLAMPTAGSVYANTLFVIDFITQRVWWYFYPFSITALMWDVADARLLAGTPNGWIMQIETGLTDTDETNNSLGITWTAKTKPFTAASDFVLENAALEYEGDPATVKAIVDSTSTITLTTMTSAAKDWIIPPFSAQVHNHAQFDIVGTMSGDRSVLYQASAEMLVEPKRVQFWRTEYETHETEQLWQVHNAALEILNTGTVTGVVFIDNVAVMTRTDLVGPTNGLRVFPIAYPQRTFGEVAVTTYTASGNLRFKHWNTKSITTPEPPRVTSWESEIKCWEDEQEFKTFECCLDPINGTVTATPMIDGTAQTPYTFTAAEKQSFARSLANDLYGRTSYTKYTSPTPFKFFNDWWGAIPEPDRVNNWKVGPLQFPSEQYVKTWVPTLNPNGTMTGTLLLDNVAISTRVFIGNDRQTFNEGIDLSAAFATQTGSFIEIYYSGVNFKHYDTQIETEPKPFGKKTWLTKYNKVGGATQVDLARWWNYDIETQGTATITSIWDTDIGSTNTETITVVGRQWVDRKPFPPGVRFHNIQHRMLSAQNFRVWKDNLDIERQGVKGFSRVTFQGNPQ